MDINILASELSAGHPVTGAYSPDPTLAADELNEVNVTAYVPISSDDLLAWTAGGATATDPSRIARLDTAKSGAYGNVIQGIASVALVMLHRDGTAISFENSSHVLMVDALLQAGVLSSDERAELLAMGTKLQSRAEQIGVETVREGHVIEARST